MKPKVNDDVLVQLNVIAKGEMEGMYRVGAARDAMWVLSDRIVKTIDPDHDPLYAPVAVPRDIEEWVAARKSAGLNTLGIADCVFQPGTPITVKGWILSNPDKFIRALANGCVVKPKLVKRYLLPITGLGDRGQYVIFNPIMNAWVASDFCSSKEVAEKYTLPTQEEIDKGPDWVRAIKAVEVQDEDC